MRWCYLDGAAPGRPMFTYLEVKGAQPLHDRLLTVYHLTRRYTTAAAAEGILWCERPMGRYTQVVVAQAMIAGAVATGCPVGWSFDEIPPQEWKRAIGLAGNASKSAVGAWAREHATEYPGEMDEHSADAYAIAYAAWLHGREG